MANTVGTTEIKDTRLRLANSATQKVELRPPNLGKEITDSLPTVEIDPEALDTYAEIYPLEELVGAMTANCVSRHVPPTQYPKKGSGGEASSNAKTMTQNASRISSNMMGAAYASRSVRSTDMAMMSAWKRIQQTGQFWGRTRNPKNRLSRIQENQGGIIWT